jgi:hypothetical protein
LSDAQWEAQAKGDRNIQAYLKTRKLLIFRDAQNAENGKIAPNWNASGTRVFVVTPEFSIRSLRSLMRTTKAPIQRSIFERSNPPGPT